jgi:hypothetical protein
MATSKAFTSKYAICVDNTEYPVALELHKVYWVLQDKEALQDGDLRIIDESGEDYLYPSSYFLPVDLPRNVVRAMNKASTRRTQPAA